MLNIASSMRVVESSMWAVVGTMWDVADTMWAVISATWADGEQQKIKMEKNKEKKYYPVSETVCPFLDRD